MTQDLDDDAEFVAAFEETVNNGRCIDWRYWAKQMPIWTPEQAARLMCALDPDVFESYENQPAAKNHSKAIATAKRIERLAHAQKMLALAPSEWLGWAVENGFCVSPLLHQVVTGCNEEKRPSSSVGNQQERTQRHERDTSDGRSVLPSLAPSPPVTTLCPAEHNASVELKTSTPGWERWSSVDGVRLWQAACLAADIEPLDGDISAKYHLTCLPQAFHDVWEAINADTEFSKLEMREHSERMLWRVHLPEFARWALGKRLNVPDGLRVLAARAVAATESAEATECLIRRPNDHDWSVKNPGRFQGYGWSLFKFLKSEKAAGRKMPNARDVLDAFGRISPPEVIEVLADALKYYDGKGNPKIADLNAIRKAIQRMTVNPADSAG